MVLRFDLSLAGLCVSALVADRAECLGFGLLAGGFVDMTKLELVRSKLRVIEYQVCILNMRVLPRPVFDICVSQFNFIKHNRYDIIVFVNPPATTGFFGIYQFYLPAFSICLETLLLKSQ